MLNVWCGGEGDKGAGLGGTFAVAFAGVGAHKPHIAVDAPVDFEAFKDAVLRQRDQVRAGYVLDNPPEHIVDLTREAQAAGAGFGKMFNRVLAQGMVGRGMHGGGMQGGMMQGMMAQQMAMAQGMNNKGGGFENPGGAGFNTGGGCGNTGGFSDINFNPNYGSPQPMVPMAREAEVSM